MLTNTIVLRARTEPNNRISAMSFRSNIVSEVVMRWVKSPLTSTYYCTSRKRRSTRFKKYFSKAQILKSPTYVWCACVCRWWSWSGVTGPVRRFTSPSRVAGTAARRISTGCWRSWSGCVKTRPFSPMMPCCLSLTTSSLQSVPLNLCWLFVDECSSPRKTNLCHTLSTSLSVITCIEATVKLVSLSDCRCF